MLKGHQSKPSPPAGGPTAALALGSGVISPPMWLVYLLLLTVLPPGGVGGRAGGLLRPCSVCRVATFCHPSSLSSSCPGFHTVSHLRRWRSRLMRRASRSAAPATQLWSRGCGAYRTGPTRSPSPPKRWSLQPRKSPRGLWALAGRPSL